MSGVRGSAIAAICLGALAAGCQLSTINGSTGFSSTGFSGGGSTGVSSSNGGSATASAATSAGASTTSGNASSTGGSTGGGSTGASTGVATSSTGGTGGGCLPNGQPCDANGQCCSEACNGTCSQPAGQACLLNADCSSDNCPISDMCGCSSPVQNQSVNPPWTPGTCAVDADCCDGVSCAHYAYLGSQVGSCCNQVGGNCQNDGECCNGSCVNGSCACLPPEYPNCQTDGDCCTGSCFFAAPPLTGGICLKTAGEPCDNLYDCFAESCVDGSCNTCSPSHAVSDEFGEEDLNGRCTSQADCCPGLVCNQIEGYPKPAPAPGVIVTANCCLPNGSSCVPSNLGLDAGACCSGNCDAGSCVCRRTGEFCQGDQSCCEGACMGGYDYGTYCCQMLGDTCFSGADCCTGSCPKGQCACVPAGGACGPPGKLAQAGSGACCSGNCSAAGACL